MRLEFIAIGIAGLILSTTLGAAEYKENRSVKDNKETMQNGSPIDHLKLLGKVHHYNEIFDNYHTGSIPYEHYKH
jgi:hypothetical protein